MTHFSAQYTLTPSRLREVVHYDPSSGVFVWLIAPAGRFRVGGVAGSRHSQGYRKIMIDRHSYLAHRLAWLWMTGKWPVAQIDHINLDKNDNHWSNLRLATNSQNCANRNAQRNNTSGFKGVYWHKLGRKWAAQIWVFGECIYLGLFDTAEEAHAAYNVSALKYFGEFSRS
jgi:hypothetical protein